MTGSSSRPSGPATRRFAWQELIIVLFIIGPLFVIPVWALVDIIQQPDHVWEATGRDRTAWLLGLILTWLFGFGVVGAVVAIVYLVGPRQALNRAAGEKTIPTGRSVDAGWYPNPEGDGERYWDGSKRTDEDAMRPRRRPTIRSLRGGVAR